MTLAQKYPRRFEEHRCLDGHLVHLKAPEGTGAQSECRLVNENTQLVLARSIPIGDQLESIRNANQQMAQVAIEAGMASVPQQGPAFTMPHMRAAMRGLNEGGFRRQVLRITYEVLVMGMGQAQMRFAGGMRKLKAFRGTEVFDLGSGEGGPRMEHIISDRIISDPTSFELTRGTSLVLADGEAFVRPNSYTRAVTRISEILGQASDAQARAHAITEYIAAIDANRPIFVYVS